MLLDNIEPLNKKMKVTYVYKQSETLYSNGIRRIKPTFITFVETRNYTYPEISFIPQRSVKFEFKKINTKLNYNLKHFSISQRKFLLYINPIISKQELIDVMFKESLYNIIKLKFDKHSAYYKMILKRDCLDYFMFSGVGFNTNPRHYFKSHINDHYYFKAIR